MMDYSCASQSNRKRNDIVVFVILFAGYLLLILYPILRADRYCNDDLIRALLGNYGWNNNGRHLTNLMMRLLQFNAQRLVDISPLPQLVAIGILSWAGVLIARRYSVQSPLLAASLAFPLGAQPFFLENLSYKFDAPCMALAMLCALLPILIPKQTRRAWFFGTASLLASLSLYQPAITVFLIFAILEFALDQGEGAPLSSLAKQLLRRIAQVLIVILVYRLMLEPAIKDWVREHGELASGANVWQVVPNNAKSFLDFVVGAFNPRWTALFAPMALLGVVLPIFASLRRTYSERRHRPLWHSYILMAAALLLPVAAPICVVGPMLLLAHPVIMPRVMLGVGALLCAALIASHAALRRSPAWHRPQLAIAGVWALGMSVYAAAYANAAAAQRQYENSIASRIAEDLSESAAHDQVHAFLLSGSAGLSPVTAHTAEQFPLVRALVASYLTENDFNSRNYLKYYVQGVENLDNPLSKSAEAAPFLKRACGAAEEHVRSAYTLRLVDDVALICFARKISPACRCDGEARSAPETNIQSLEQIQ